MQRKAFIAIILIVTGVLVIAACRKNKPLIGQHYQGGIVFYVDGSGKHGLIAAPTDQSSGISWSNGTDTVTTTAAGTAMGTGKSNTDAIVAQPGAGNYAAKLCADLIIDGYDDWYLPRLTNWIYYSIKSLWLVVLQIHIIGVPVIC